MAENTHGKVTRTFPRKGYFWIQGSDGEDYFGHVSQVTNTDAMTEVFLPDKFLTPSVGQECSCLALTGPKGPEAKHIVLG